MGQEVYLADPTVDELATQKKLTGYKAESEKVANLIIRYQQGYQSDKVDFSKVDPMGINKDPEQSIFATYTDKTCLEAVDTYERFLQMAKYWAIFLTFLILLLTIICCICCLAAYKIKKQRAVEDFFGYNNGEDNLKIDHHWQEDSEPKPIYINVRDPNLKGLQVQKPGQYTSY